MDLEFRSDNFTFTDSTGGGVEISLSFKSYSLENLMLLCNNVTLLNTYASSFYRSQNVLGWSKCFVLDQKLFSILCQFQIFALDQKIKQIANQAIAVLIWKEIWRLIWNKEVVVLFEKIKETEKIGNWKNKKQETSKIHENIRNGPNKIYHRFL